MALIAYKGQGILHLTDNAYLMPGVNKIEDKEWEQAKKLATISSHYLAKGLIKDLGEKKERSEEERLELIAECNSEPTLRDMLAAEKSLKVRDAIHDRIEELQPERDKGEKDK